MNSQMTSAEALQLLLEGNERFNSGLRSIETAMSVSKMRELAEKGQAPFAIVLTCSDSRVPTEMLFDRGLGDIFVIRIAGNVVSPMVIASVEYAAQVLGSPLCVVMGHTKCGAVATAVNAENDEKGKVANSLTPDLTTLISAIRPAVRHAKEILGKSHTHEECLHEATMANIHRSVEQLGQSAVISERMKKNQLAIIGAICDIHTGVVNFDHHPLLSALIAHKSDQIPGELSRSANGSPSPTSKTLMERTASITARKRVVL
jgi:carbonic anhydrase